MIVSSSDRPAVSLQSVNCGTLASDADGNERVPRKGMAEYRAWLGMRQRCENPHEPNFKHYGGQGITVCPSWRESFDVFLAHVGRKPTADHSLHRIDNDRGYEPGNVRWATQKEQCQNRRYPVGDQRTCAHCGVALDRVRRGQKFCRPSCRAAFSAAKRERRLLGLAEDLVRLLKRRRRGADARGIFDN